MEGWILASLLQTSVSHDQLHFDAEKKTFAIVFINVENNYSA